MSEPVKYIQSDEVSEVKVTSKPRFFTASGYGRKILTAYMLRVANRWYRVYCVRVYSAYVSNSGSLYIIRNGEWEFLSSTVEHRVEDARDAKCAV